MSTVSAAPAPATFLPAQVVLPSGAQAEFALENYTNQGDLAPGTDIVYEIGATYYEIPLAVFGNFSASSTAATRQVVMIALDVNGNPKWEMVPMFDQTANSGGAYTFAPGIQSSVSASGGFAVSVIPYWVFYPGESIRVTATNLQAGDQWTDVAITTLAVPTGELFDLTPTVTPVASPALV